MEVRQTYIFFLIITTVGALLTIKICTAAYGVYDYTNTAPVAYTSNYKAAKNAKNTEAAQTKLIEQPGADGLDD